MMSTKTLLLALEERDRHLGRAHRLADELENLLAEVEVNERSCLLCGSPVRAHKPLCSVRRIRAALVDARRP